MQQRVVNSLNGSHKEVQTDEKKPNRESKPYENLRCYRCLEFGHICRHYDKNRWILDSGSTDHMCCHLSKFKDFKEKETIIEVAGGERLLSTGFENIDFTLSTYEITLLNVLYVPNLKSNLISVNKMMERGLKIIFSKDSAEAWAANKFRLSKLSPKGMPCKFIEYDENAKAYRFYDDVKDNFFISRDVKFAEDVFPIRQQEDELLNWRLTQIIVTDETKEVSIPIPTEEGLDFLGNQNRKKNDLNINQQIENEEENEENDRFKFTILNAVLVSKKSDLTALVDAEARVMLLYCTREEAIEILTAAKDYHITGENYVWVVTQSVIENPLQPSNQFPVGMLGVHFDTSSASLVNEITTAIKVFAYGVEDFINDPKNEGRALNTQLSCDGEGAARWDTGDRFYKYLRNVSVEQDVGKPNVEFTQDGVLKATELKIMNLRPAGPGQVKQQLVWEEIGVWKSWQSEGLDIKDIVWPGDSHTPPQGVPEKFHLKITFLEEPPYINLAPPDPVTGKCSMDRGVLCRIATEADITEVDASQAHRNGSFYQCCSGFCIDLLEKFAEELAFTYELVRVEDGRWGTNENGKWNGLIADLVNKRTDMVMTSLMINSEREAAVDFSVPFMETGIAIVVVKRTGIISPTAFLEPFDTASWMLVGVVAIQAATFTIFLFEWLSPSGFDMRLSLNQSAPSASHRFSLFRTYWLVWAVLFQAAGMGSPLPGSRTRRLAPGIHGALHDQRLGDVRSRLPCHLHCQFSRLHDHQGRILRILSNFLKSYRWKCGVSASWREDHEMHKILFRTEL
ncbi:Receptor family ligand binding region [Popillia japonica]|uniref:Receptor family ligand binding region n=1 Tax=Popillia japonica TaxID=7064 RepID=A0AAW1JE66_POPJA